MEMTEADRKILCSKPDCEVTASGVCAEGHEPLEACPYYGKEPEDVDDGDVQSEPTDNDDAPTTGDRIALPTGQALDVAGVDEFLLWRPISLIAIVGDRDSGKTTLICSIYDRFLKGPFASFVFAGSRTLVGLERQSHYSRAESGRSVADTPRTSISDGLTFFHFAVAPERQPQRRSDLMVSDRAGEVYRQARGQTDLIADIIEIRKAARVVLLLDGTRVADQVERAGAIQNVRQTLRAFLDNDALTAASIVQVVTTKIDLFEGHQDKQSIDSTLEQFRQRLTADFANRLAELSFWEVSARDPRGELEPAFGVDKLLQDWVSLRSPDVNQAPSWPSCQNEFDRLLERTPMGSSFG